MNACITPPRNPTLPQVHSPLIKNLLLYAAIFCVSFAFLFLALDRRVGVYDEGLVLTAAMRVMAGQVPHRDFYINYGPAQSYLFAALFKLFGPSVLLARLVDMVFKASLIVSIYALCARYCRISVAALTAAVCLLWLVGMSYYEIALTPISLFSLWTTMLVFPGRVRSASARNVILAGALAGVTALFRYDIGAAFIAVHSVLLVLAAADRRSSLPSFLRDAGAAIGLYLLGFALVFVPAALAYLSVAPMHPFLYDIVLFQREYYRSGRSLPFPGIHVRHLDDLAIYLPILAILLSVWVIVRSLRAQRHSPPSAHASKESPDWIAFLIAFTLLATVMYLKGLVRVSIVHVYLSLLPSLLLIAVLFEHRLSFRPPVRALVSVAMGISVLSASVAFVNEGRLLAGQRSSVLMRLLSPSRESPRPPQAAWCTLRNPLTTGPCFLLDPDHMAAAVFLRSHTRPGDTLFVGVPHHDHIYANDNATYFATGRLPATQWSHFDPGLQNRADIQRDIMRELDAHAPPYIALDSEFEQVHEPNDSSRRTGVHLLDRYIENHYQLVETFGEMTIWQRTPAR